ncbi:MAG: hypothetical protein WC346_04325 [Methanogenium sp.]|jgi:hypothetical protein
MSYKELQKQAKELGLKYVGVSEKDLKLAVSKALVKEDKKPSKASSKPKEKSEEPKDKDADAVVYYGKRKVRTYTLERHGKDYVKLAKQFISHPEREEYRVEFETVETRLTCPHCGKKFRYN